MRGRIILSLAIIAAAGAFAGPAEADTGGPVVTHPGSTPFDYPAGEVCAFPAHVEFPVSDLTEQVWYDGAGRPLFGTETGALVIRITNTDTGRTVDRNISGDGTLVYPTLDQDDFVLSGGDWSAGFHGSDSPASARHHWYISHGFMSVRVTRQGGQITRQLLALVGPYEDICEVLAG
ncbi:MULTISPECIES: hypothetical protein [unclassified Nocardia]|uniref:hypothetical protein n=1 Tax=unclassified Nocardia TaxID=2637762 RepID=UPI001CE48F6B|nr:MULTISPECIES: hypothetical protein [unclassified Nocardia]